MIASDPIRALHHLLRAGGRPHMDCPVKPGNDNGKVNLIEKCSKDQRGRAGGSPVRGDRASNPSRHDSTR